MKKSKRDRQVFEAFTMVLQFSISMLVPIGLCTALGVWLGNRTGISWMLVPFFILGVLSGGTGVYKMARRFISRSEGRKN
ncbi:MAG: AtpZ/AtpI family protein [Clostridiales bacterium]|nr:AtpZ/AtpI family protein [Clostridiales bacterium]